MTVATKGQNKTAPRLSHYATKCELQRRTDDSQLNSSELARVRGKRTALPRGQLPKFAGVKGAVATLVHICSRLVCRVIRLPSLRSDKMLI